MNSISAISNFSRIGSNFPEFEVAIVGGGPGGLFAAWHLAAKTGNACKITIYEASERLGGKIITRQFAGAGPYEAGVAEIYDYSALGPDPLRNLIETELGLEIKHISGGACVLHDKIITDRDALLDQFGPQTFQAVTAFHAKCSKLLSQSEYYTSARNFDNRHVWARISAEEMLATEVSDEIARRYVRVMTHSDVAAPPHLTNGLTFLKNVLMDHEGYMTVFSVVGGNEQIVDRLAKQIDAKVQFNSTLRSVHPSDDGAFRLGMHVCGKPETIAADYIVLALPLTALSIIDWRSSQLQQAMADHINYFDRPGHYLRATLLFEQPFWRDVLPGAWWMLDAFDGCCVYDEDARNSLGECAALGFLIAGNAALGLANLPDSAIERLCLDALPSRLAHGRKLLVDSRVHRWMASVNAIPGGFPVRSAYRNHRPADHLPGMVLVGDYMFDATLNGVLDSADAATDILLAEVLRMRRVRQAKVGWRIGSRWSDGFDAEGQEGAFDAAYLAAMLDIVWGVHPGARILNVGSGSGNIVASLRALGFDAMGLEATPSAWNLAPRDLYKFNLFGAPLNLDVSDGHFDVVIDTGLCRFERERLPQILAEIRRVTKHGLILGSVTSDLPIELIERRKLLGGLKTFASRWDWSDQLLAIGFDFALADPYLLDAAWKKSVAAGVAPGDWYEDEESFSYCFYRTIRSAADDMAAATEANRIIENRLYVDARVPATLL